MHYQTLKHKGSQTWLLNVRETKSMELICVTRVLRQLFEMVVTSSKILEVYHIICQIEATKVIFHLDLVWLQYE